MSTRRDVDAPLDEWVAAGVITSTVAADIRAYEAAHIPQHAPPSTEGRPGSAPSVAEALGYLGGVLALAGLVSLAANYWDEVSVTVRSMFVALAAIALAAGGRAIDESASHAMARLRWVLWTVSTAATALFVGVLLVDVFSVDSRETITLGVALAVVAQSGIMWAGRHRPLQLAAMLAAITVAAGAMAAQVGGTGFVGLIVWVTGASILAVGLWRRPAESSLYVATGALGAVVGSTITVEPWQGPGMILMCTTAVALLVVAVVPTLTPDRWSAAITASIGVLGLLQGAPMTIVHFSHQAGGITGAVMWGIGALVVGTAATRRLRARPICELAGGLLAVGGAAVIATESVATAVVLGLATSIALLVIGAVPERAVLSIAGSIGLLVNVPWAIGHFFPGEGRMPLLVLVTGLLIVGVAVLLTRRAPRLGAAMHDPRHDTSDT